MTQICADKIPQRLVFNKSDLLDKRLAGLLDRFHEDALTISAAKDVNIEALVKSIEANLLGNQQVSLILPYEQTALVSRLHNIAVIESEEYKEDGIYLKITISEADKHIIQAYIV